MAAAPSVSPPIRRALISVSDKLGVADLARGLTTAGVEIYSTGGTRSHLESQGIPVIDVAAYTGFPEMMHGRLKTLHPKIFGGILCRFDHPDDLAAIEQYGIHTFELVVVNLYPFQATVAREGVTLGEAIDNIDIGGPSMVRAAAKNQAFITVATSPEQYASILQEITTAGCTTLETRRRLAGEAFEHTASYDRAIADYFAGNSRSSSAFADTLHVVLQKKSELRYGENPHQQAAVYCDPKARGASLVSARQLHGKELSYNNLLDLDSALAIARSFDRPAATVVKHNNPCGAAVADTLATAAQNALAGDPQSAFGGIIAFNRAVDAATAEVLATPGLFIEAVVAPEFAPEAITILTSKPKWKANVRLMQVGALEGTFNQESVRFVEGGALVQTADIAADDESSWKVVTKTQPNEAALNDLRFAWQLVRHVKSNAIVVAKDSMLLGAGAGQMSRVDAVEIAIRKAGERVRGAVLASDAFFPFADSVEQAAAAGIVALIQPGGSVKDADVITACDQHGIAMVFTGRRHFKH